MMKVVSLCPLHQEVSLKADVPLVADMTNTILTKRIEWDRFNCVFASVYPNVCINGIVLVMVRKSAVKTQKHTPLMSSYSVFIVS